MAPILAGEATRNITPLVRELLETGHYETARRLCRVRLAAEGDDPEVRAMLAECLLRLGAPAEGLRLLDDLPENLGTALQRVRAEHAFCDYHEHYTRSPAAARGLSYEEYRSGILDRRNGAARRCLALARSADPEAQRHAISILRRVGENAIAAELSALLPSRPVPVRPRRRVRVHGRLRHPDGRPVQGRVQLLVAEAIAVDHPHTVAYPYIWPGTEGCHPVESLGGDLAADGSFDLAGEVGPGAGILALTGPEADLGVRFLARDIDLDAPRPRGLDVTLRPWTSAAARSDISPPTSIWRDGQRRTLIAGEHLRNPYWFDFPRQDLRLDWGLAATDAGCGLLIVDGQETDFEILPDGTLLTFIDLPARAGRSLAFYRGGRSLVRLRDPLLSVEESTASAVIDTGPACFRIPWGEGHDDAGPILQVLGSDGVWRGDGRMRLPAGIALRRSVQLVHLGHLETTVEIVYRFSDGASCRFRLTAHAGEEYLLVHESGDALAGAGFDFALDEFSGGRGYLHSGAEGEARRWHDLIAEDREVAWIQEQTPWWLPQSGFAWAATFDGCDSQDLVAVVGRRRGDWIDHAFASACHGPADHERELDWPYPEMLGSTVSMIRCATTASGGVRMHFGRFHGERHWALLVSAFARGDGLLKEIHHVRHKTSSPRLDALRRWRFAAADAGERPRAAARREDLPRLRDLVCGPSGDRLAGGKPPAPTLAALLTQDAATLWRRARRLAVSIPIWTRLLLLDRECGDTCSPVGIRFLTPAAEEFDLVVGTGAFHPDEEIDLRAGLVAWGHLLISPDFMNWRYGSRNANFEADRVDVVGTVGLVLSGNPDGDAFVAHALERLRDSLAAYCTPGSGRWYENPACYYLQASSRRLNLAARLHALGVQDLGSIPRLADFLRWGVLLLTPPLPADPEAMRTGCTYADYAGLARIRRIAPIGDHAGLGGPIPEHYAVAARQLRGSDPALAALLLWAWQEGGRDGGAFANPTLLHAFGDGEDRPSTAIAPPLESRRLEGFGAVFRGDVGGEREFMLLVKFGPGGYRYHRSEGSFILVADGRPLVYDGGEGGEAWRHSTVTWHASRLPPVPGRVDRFASFPGVDAVLGSSPIVPRPGIPIALCDRCDLDLVAEARRRGAISDPAARRAIVWIKDDYVVVLDRLNAESDDEHQWHLHVLADGEDHDPALGWRFRGRFGTDLQVIMPDLADRPWRCENLPMLDYRTPPEGCVAQRHLQVEGGSGSGDYLAVLRPLPPGAPPLAATALRADGRIVGVHVTGPGIDDVLVLAGVPVRLAAAGVDLVGDAGGVIRRGDRTDLFLLGAGRLRCGGRSLVSDGPAAHYGDGLSVSGPGSARASDGTRTLDASAGGGPAHG